jgi:hypothetical protein
MVSIVRFDRQQNSAGTLYGHVIQQVFTSWSSLTTFTTQYAYQPINGGTLSITPLASSSKFHVMLNIQGYCLSTGGMQMGINRVLSGNTTRLVGVDGSTPGDTWSGTGDGNGGNASNSYTINRHWLDSPGVAAGTVITYNALAGLWANGTAFVGYSGYAGTSSITIWEIQP